MNATQLFTNPLAQAIGWALLHLIWQATIVAGILAATLSLLKRHSANARYAASCGALTLVFAMFVATAYRAYEPPVPSTGAMSVSDEKMVPVTRVPVMLAQAATESWRDRAIDFASSAQHYLPAIVAIWLLGVVVLSSRLLVSWARARRLAYRGTKQASVQWLHAARRLSDALGLRRAVMLVESAAVEVPSVIGSLRPVILLPAAAIVGMTPEQIEMVLAHELAHIRRHDFLVNLLQAVVETLMFYHPAVWWMSRRVRVERENCCDDLAVAVCGNPIQYARALTRLEELRAHAPAITVAANGGSLMDRIRRLVTDRAESNGSTSRWAAAVAMLSVVIIAIAVPSLPALAERDTNTHKAKPAKPAPPAAHVEVVAPAPPSEITPAPPAEPATPAPEAVAAEEAYADIDIDLPDSDETPYPVIAPVAVPAPVVTVRPAVAPRVVVPTPRVHVTTPMPAVAPIARMAMADAMRQVEMFLPEGESRDRDRSDDGKMGKDGKLTVDELIRLRNSGVTPAYVQKMRNVFPDITLGQIVQLASVGVTPEYVANLRAAGVDIKTSKDARQLAAMGVSTAFVKKLADAGYSNLTVKELTRLAAAGVDEEFIREMSKYRDKN
jgi:beta-lactamase regulating signal transducer with metallopeptidase domain